MNDISYDPSRYLDVETFEQAISVILNETEGMTSDQRWAEEKPFITALLKLFINEDAFVLDYGCGIGRLAKPLVEQLECTVVGVDISKSMCEMATAYVDRPKRFVAMHPVMLEDVVRKQAFDVAIAIWTLQHCRNLADAMEHLTEWLKPKGKLIVVNDIKRAIPVANGEWWDDGQIVHDLLLEHFRLIDKGTLDASIAPGWMQDGTFWAVYQK